MAYLGEPTRNNSLAVGTAAVIVAPAPIIKRTSIYIRNTSTGTQRITVVMGNQAAVVNNGIVLAPDDTIVDSNSEGYECWQGSINAIADAANGQLSIYER